MPKGQKGFAKGNNEGHKTKGKKKGKTLEKEALLLIMKEKIQPIWDELIDKKIELGRGVYVLKPVIVDGKVVDAKVYKEKPDGQALEYLFSLMVGDPKKYLELSGNVGNLPEVPEELREQIRKFKEWQKSQKK
jgi:hypothetical protein